MVRRRLEVVSEGIYSRRFHKCLQNAGSCFGHPQRLGLRRETLALVPCGRPRARCRGASISPSPPRSLLTACFLDFGQLLYSLGAQLCTKTTLCQSVFVSWQDSLQGLPQLWEWMLGVQMWTQWQGAHRPASVTALRSNI